MSDEQAGLLLDTCAAIWFGEGMLSEAALQRIFASADAGLFVSPITGWEVGVLSYAGKLRFLPDPQGWFARLMALPAIQEAPFSGAIAIAAYQLPGVLHNDPADRMLIATARHLNVPILTRDRKIIDYGKQGLVAVVEC